MSTPRRSSALALGLLLAVAALAAAPARAEEDPVAKVRELEALVHQPDATWEARWDAYQAMLKAIEAAEGPAKGEAQAAYDAIRKPVADAIRREELPLSGWLMAFFGASLLWGGLAFCIGVARKKGGSGGKGAA